MKKSTIKIATLFIISALLLDKLIYASIWAFYQICITCINWGL